MFGKTPWDSARLLPMQRYNATAQTMERVEPGCRFFILSLELLGAKPDRSTEGQPYGFRIDFRAPEEIAKAIESAGPFDIRNNPLKEGSWALTLRTKEGRDWGYDARDQVLRAASLDWVKAFRRLAILDTPLPIAA